MPTPNLAALSAGIVQPIEPLVSGQLASGGTAIYTVGASKAAKLDSLTLTNVSNGGVVVSVSAVPSGAAVDSSRRLGPSITVPAGDSVTFDEVKGWYPAGTIISVSVGAGSAINAKLTGLEFS